MFRSDLSIYWVDSWIGWSPDFEKNNALGFMSQYSLTTLNKYTVRFLCTALSVATDPYIVAYIADCMHLMATCRPKNIYAKGNFGAQLQVVWHFLMPRAPPRGVTAPSGRIEFDQLVIRFLQFGVSFVNVL